MSTPPTYRGQGSMRDIRDRMKAVETTVEELVEEIAEDDDPGDLVVDFENALV